MDHNSFHTLRGYDQLDKSPISPSMEDYLEMICRLAGSQGFVRVNQLAGRLNVTPPSASKMVAKLRDNGLVDYTPYGIIQLTAEGRQLGSYLLHRHEILHQFFCMINKTADELELVEKIEHFIDRRTVGNLERWLATGSAKQAAPK